MIIDTEKEQITLTITIDEAFNLLSGNGLSDQTWMHLAGIMGEWYHDTLLDRYVPPPEQEQKNDRQLTGTWKVKK